MWVQTLEGNIINLDFACGVQFVEDYWEKGPTVVAVSPDQQSTVSLYKGTEQECHAFIAELLEKLNAPLIDFSSLDAILHNNFHNLVQGMSR
jgi:hypothetical protein